MTRHFGMLLPATNTTVEMECRLLPPAYQAHFARLKSTSTGPFAPSRDEDIDYQSQLLGSARVELLILIQTSASLHSDDYDKIVAERMRDGAGVPALTSAQAVGRAARALGARRIGIVSPYSEAVNARAARYFATSHGLETVALEGFSAAESHAIAQIGPEQASAAFARIDRPEIDAFLVPGGNFPTMAAIATWEQEVHKPIVTTNQASFWAMLRAFDAKDPLPGYGRLLAELPAG